MHALALVFVFGLMANPLVNGATNLKEYNENFDKQFKKPVVEAVYKVNQ